MGVLYCLLQLPALLHFYECVAQLQVNLPTLNAKSKILTKMEVVQNCWLIESGYRGNIIAKVSTKFQKLFNNS